jgi:hypothetical protein
MIPTTTKLVLPLPTIFLPLFIFFANKLCLFICIKTFL